MVIFCIGANQEERKCPVVLDRIVSEPVISYMQRGMAAASLRQEVISNNIANVNTPRFKKSDVVFEELLAKEIYGEPDDGKLKMVRTHDKHLPMEFSFHAEPSIQLDDTTTMRVDKNNVDIDIEMANLAKNQLYYNALATQAKQHFTRLKNVITSGQS